MVWCPRNHPHFPTVPRFASQYFDTPTPDNLRKVRQELDRLTRISNATKQVSLGVRGIPSLCATNQHTLGPMGPPNSPYVFQFGDSSKVSFGSFGGFVNSACHTPFVLF